MWTKRFTLWRFMLCALLAVSVLGATARGEEDNVPSESQCRPYIEKALKKGLETEDAVTDSTESNESSEVNVENDSKEAQSDEEQQNEPSSDEDEAPSVEVEEKPYSPHKSGESLEATPDQEEDSKEDDTTDSKEEVKENVEGGDSNEESSADESTEKESEEQGEEQEDSQDGGDSQEQDEDNKEGETDGDSDSKEKSDEDKEAADEVSEGDADETKESAESKENADDNDEEARQEEDEDKSQEVTESEENAEEDANEEEKEQTEEKQEESEEESTEGEKSDEKEDETADEVSQDDDSEAGSKDSTSAEEIDDTQPESDEKADDAEEKADESQEGEETSEVEETEGNEDENTSEDEEEEGAPEEDLLLVPEIPENLRSREHIHKILRLDEDASENELTVEKAADIVLRDLKRLYESSIKPLEGLYKYRDLSNRHFGDPEIFSKPLVLFMGPWSGGKSSILNYLTGLEFTEWSLRTGAEPSPAYFNILMHGKEPAVLDGTQLAADWTFSGLQKFGQGLEERLRGLRYPSKLLEKVNIVEIPGILEVRKQVSRIFPFNDACQWFIDRADIIFLVYDPSKLDVGPETEAILDQLKGRESQTRIVLNKADIVKPEELLRVQSALIWNISPLMSSAQPPVMYTVSLWSMPYEASAPTRLLQAQERELLRDLRHAVDKRIENKIASARRFAVRVRNHAKMVDCYLTTYYNHKTIFGNKRLIADAIIENPQNYHIYEGLSTLTNISRYDLPDPETYRDFFRLNPLYEFQQLSATCTYFRGCPINQLDIAIAYDLPELVGKYKKMVETATPQGMPKS